MSANPGAFTIGTLSRRSDCSIDTIRYYERLRLMPPIPRSTGGHRLYNDTHLRRLRLIRRSRALGLSLEQTRALIKSAERNGVDCDSARSLLTAQVGRVRDRIREFRRLERTLSAMLDACADATRTNCRVLEGALADAEPDLAAGCCTRDRDEHEAKAKRG